MKSIKMTSNHLNNKRYFNCDRCHYLCAKYIPINIKSLKCDKCGYNFREISEKVYQTAIFNYVNNNQQNNYMNNQSNINKNRNIKVNYEMNKNNEIINNLVNNKNKQINKNIPNNIPRNNGNVNINNNIVNINNKNRINIDNNLSDELFTNNINNQNITQINNLPNIKSIDNNLSNRNILNNINLLNGANFNNNINNNQQIPTNSNINYNNNLEFQSNNNIINQFTNINNMKNPNIFNNSDNSTNKNFRPINEIPININTHQNNSNLINNNNFNRMNIPQNNQNYDFIRQNTTPITQLSYTQQVIPYTNDNIDSNINSYKKSKSSNINTSDFWQRIDSHKDRKINNTSSQNQNINIPALPSSPFNNSNQQPLSNNHINEDPMNEVLDNFFGDFFNETPGSISNPQSHDQNLNSPQIFFHSFFSPFGIGEGVFSQNYSSNFNRNFFGDIDNLMQLIQRGRKNPHPPATQEALRKLKRFPLQERFCQKKKGKLELPNCCICQCEIELGKETVLLPCGHMYHWDCCSQWLNTNNTCPICRFEVK